MKNHSFSYLKDYRGEQNKQSTISLVDLIFQKWYSL